MLKLFVKLLATEAAKELVVYIVSVVAKRTDNTIDDTVVVAVAKLMGVPPTSCLNSLLGLSPLRWAFLCKGALIQPSQ